MNDFLRKLLGIFRKTKAPKTLSIQKVRELSESETHDADLETLIDPDTDSAYHSPDSLEARDSIVQEVNAQAAGTSGPQGVTEVAMDAIDAADDGVTVEAPLETALDMSTRGRFNRWLTKIRSKLSAPKTDILKSGRSLQGIRWSELSRQIFSPNHRGFIHRAFIIALSISMAYSVGKVVALLIKGKPATVHQNAMNITLPKPIEAKDFVAIRTANLFNADKSSLDDKRKAELNKKCTSANAASSLPITLINTIVMQDSVKSIASVQSRTSSGEAKKVREGDIIDGQAQIGRIARLELIVKNLGSGRCEYIANKEANVRGSSINVLSPEEGRKVMAGQLPTGIKNEGDKFTIQRGFLNDKLKDIGSILTQARAIQINNPDGTICFNIQEVEAGSIYNYLGIQNNDTICDINGKKMTNVNEVMDLFGKIRNLDHLDLGINREGLESKLEYNIGN